MTITFLRRFSIFLIFIMLGACASTPPSRFFEEPPPQVERPDQELFQRALDQQQKGQISASIASWKKFLEKNPRSYEAHNNLGMVYYVNDQVNLAIAEFEQGLALEPNDTRIKDNLTRALQFQVTLKKENRDYHGAITYLHRMAEMASPQEREKIGRDIELLEDRIFEQVQRTDTLEDYQDFLFRYPDSPQNSDEARKRIEELQAEMGVTAKGVEDMPFADDESSFADDMSIPMSRDAVPEPQAHVEEPVIEIVEQTETIMEEPVAVPEQMPEAAPAPPAPPAPVPQMEPEPEPEPEPVQRVVIKTKKDPLRVRAEPSARAKVVGRIKKGGVVPLQEEKGEWFRVEYQPGRSGWISKKFSQVLK